MNAKNEEKKQRQNMRYETAGIIREVMGGNMDTVLVIYVELLLHKKIVKLSFNFCQI